MKLLHHVAMHPRQEQGWAQLLNSLGEGDMLVLLDQAAANLPEVAIWHDRAAPGVRWLLPQIARGQTGELPPGIELVDDRQWWQLIMAHERLLEWN